MSDKKSKKAKKPTLADFKLKPFKLKIITKSEIPKETWLLIRGAHSHAFVDAQMEFAENVENLKTMDEMAYARSKTLSKLIVGWDEEMFGEFNEESATEMFSDQDLSWILDDVEEATNDVARFFN